MNLSPLRYPGGKTKAEVRRKILACAPLRVTEYREAFVGGGGIFFGIDDYFQVFNKPKSKWINDLDTDLISVYLALRDNPSEFIAKCKAVLPMQPGEDEVFPTPNSSGQKVNRRLKEQFDRCIADTTIDPAFSYFFVNRTNWAGRVDYTRPSRLYFSNAQGWDIVSTDRLERAAKCLANTKITNGDYSVLLTEPGENVWVYLDPPYVKDTKLSHNSKLYRHSFAIEDHQLFAQRVKECKHKVCISYDDDDDGIVRSLFPVSDGFFIKELAWAYCGTSSANGQSKTKKIGRELIITNYAIERN